jgi:hypothetical protein
MITVPGPPALCICLVCSACVLFVLWCVPARGLCLELQSRCGSVTFYRNKRGWHSLTAFVFAESCSSSRKQRIAALAMGNKSSTSGNELVSLKPPSQHSSSEFHLVTNVSYSLFIYCRLVVVAATTSTGMMQQVLRESWLSCALPSTPSQGKDSCRFNE